MAAVAADTEQKIDPPDRDRAESPPQPSEDIEEKSKQEFEDRLQMDRENFQKHIIKTQLEYEELKEKYTKLADSSISKGEMQKLVDNYDERLKNKETESRTLKEIIREYERKSSNLSKDNPDGESACCTQLCESDEDKYKLECKKCNRLVHYRCTRLPLYQIEHFMKSGYSRFICANCTTIQKYLLDIPASSNVAPLLRTEVERLKQLLAQKQKENDSLIEDNSALTTKGNKLQNEHGGHLLIKYSKFIFVHNYNS